MNDAIMKKFDCIENMIGHTPLLEISLTFKGRPRKVYAKAEYLNLTGSIKDRVAFHIMKKAYREGTLKPGDIRRSHKRKHGHSLFRHEQLSRT